MATFDERYWDDCSEGETLRGFELKLTWTTMVSQVEGSQDWNTVHHDPDFAIESGHKGIFYNTGWTSAMLTRVITDWMGPTGRVTRVQFQMRQMNANGDTVLARGRVVDKSVGEDGLHIVHLDVWLENDRVGVTTPGHADVTLPARDGA